MVKARVVIPRGSQFSLCMRHHGRSYEGLGFHRRAIPEMLSVCLNH